MIENSERIQGILKNIIYQVDIIRKDFERNGETHYEYILEKLHIADWDLNVMIKMAESQKEKEEKND